MKLNWSSMKPQIMKSDAKKENGSVQGPEKTCFA